ncbi:hypothetical protein D3C75_1055750 [compost metagenome]
MNIVLLVEIRCQTQLLRLGTGVTEGGLCRFLHYIAQLSSQRQLAGALYYRHFDQQRVAANLRPGQPGYRTDLILQLSHSIAVLRDTKVILDLSGKNADFFLLSGYNLLRGLTAQRSNLLLQITHPGFPCVLTDDLQ